MTDTRIAVTEETRDLVRDLKRGGETYDDLLRRMAAQYDPDANVLGEWDVPLVDARTGDGWTETIEAATASEAAGRALEGEDPDVVVASTFMSELVSVDADEADDFGPELTEREQRQAPPGSDLGGDAVDDFEDGENEYGGDDE